MTQRFDDEGNMTTYKGDTILFDVNNVPTDLNYTVYFGVYDDNGNSIIPEQSVIANYNSTVTFEVKPYVTDMVIIPAGKKSVTYRYGIKACNFENQVEHTQTVDGVDVGEETKITFVRKQVEGITSWGDTDSDSDSDSDTDTDTDIDTDTDTDTDTDNDNN